MKPLRIAHRGSLSRSPENSMQAFKEALKADVDMIELDIRVCKTGEAVIMHDPTIDRTTNGKGKVKDMTLAELRQFYLQNGENIPLLMEILNTLSGKVVLNLEIKTYQTAEPVVRLLHTYIKSGKIRYTSVILSSANVLTLGKISRLDNRFLLSVVVRFLPSLVTRYSYRFKPFSIQPLHKIATKKYVEKLQEKDIKVFPWALKPSDDGSHFIQKMKKIGTDGIMSFFPEKIPERKH